MRNFLTFAALLLLSPAAFAQGQGGPTTVAVAEVTARGNADADMASEVSDALTDQLVGDGRFRGVERQQIAKGMKEQRRAESGVMSDEVQNEVAQVKDGAQAAARSLALRFPKLTGRILNALPNGTASCSFDSGEPFKGEFFEISGRDDVTEQEARKGWFLLSSWSRSGCSGRIKRRARGDHEDGDTLTSSPLKHRI